MVATMAELIELRIGGPPVLVLLYQVCSGQSLLHHGSCLLPHVSHNGQLQLPTELVLPSPELGRVGRLRPDLRHPLTQLDPAESMLLAVVFFGVPHI